jgi:hypothetical protein
MHIAVLIPSHHQVPPALLAWTLEGYLGQQLSSGHTLEVAVGVDGGLEAGFRPPPPTPLAPPSGMLAGAVRVRQYAFPRMGAAAVRNRLAAGARADLLIFGNADARPDPDMVQQHADAFTSLPDQGKNSLILGSAPWELPPAPALPTVFDALLAETPMVFFYHALQAGSWYDFRHCWTLNLSVRADDFQASGGFHEQIRPVYYEDLAFGHRFLGGTRTGILYHAAARVTHRHPTTLAQYLDREELLGLMAPVLASVAPEAFAAVFGTPDVARMASAYETWIQMDGPMHRWTYKRLANWAGQEHARLPPPSTGDGADRRRLLDTIYQMHIPLKRLAFRLGFLKGLTLADDRHWQQRLPVGLWRRVVE